MGKKASSAIKNVENFLNEHSISSLIGIILAVFIGGYLINLFIGGGLMHKNTEFFENSNMNGRIVYYYMNGCPACQNFNSTWEQFESQYSGNMSIEKIEQSNAGNDLSIYNIQGFPTVVKLDSQNTLVDTFNSERTVDNLLNFAS
jgi:thiol-disulfide isomerase/thioredoxin